MDTQTSHSCAKTISKPTIPKSPSGMKKKTKQNYFFHLSLSVVCGNSKLGCSNRYTEQSTLMMNNAFYTEKGPQATHMLETSFCS